MTRASTPIAIIGGGIGGLCLAQYLRRSGLRAEVFERDVAAASRWDGYRLHINPAGARALRASLPAEAWDAFVATSGPAGDFRFLTDQLEHLVTVEESLMYPTAAGEHFAVDRRVLRQLLLCGLDSVHFGAEFADFEPSDHDQLTAGFCDGRTVTTDLLIGADGAGSRVRRRVLPGRDNREVGVGAYAHKIFLDDENRSWLPETLQHGMTTVLSDGPAFLFTAAYEPPADAAAILARATGGTDAEIGRSYVLAALVLDAGHLPEDMERLTTEAIADRADQISRDWHPALRRLLAEADPASRRAIRFRSAPPLQTWTSDEPVTLLGDAVHSMPPVGGLGANTALRDAHLLGRRLREAANTGAPPRSVILGYEAELRRYSTQAMTSAATMRRQGLRRGLSYQASAAWLRLCARAPWLKRRTFERTWRDPARARPWERASTTSRSNLVVPPDGVAT